MKKGKLYTVTPWNKQAFVKAEPLPAKNFHLLQEQLLSTIIIFKVLKTV